MCALQVHKHMILHRFCGYFRGSVDLSETSQPTISRVKHRAMLGDRWCSDGLTFAAMNGPLGYGDRSMAVAWMLHGY